MEQDFLKPSRAAGSRLRQAEDARKMQENVLERCQRKTLEPPKYNLLELIGKGNYGRVYKSENRETKQVCAVKIIEVDKQDYEADGRFRDDTIKEFLKETQILHTLREKDAKNVNLIYEAFAVDTQLWIVSEYCPGGSLTTLIKASPRKNGHVGCLEERFIIPIAREVALALTYVHSAGIIHRDVKCANILVTEDGRIQLCDFGVSGFLENEVSKRNTIIGTPHWMAPELVSYLGEGPNPTTVQYGTEIDCWAYGSTVFEMATGYPPDHRLQVRELRTRREYPRLEGDRWSEALKDFISFCLEESPEQRPTAAQIREHTYIRDTEQKYPTKGIQELIERFAVWEKSGNQRESLFNGYGAQGPEDMSEGDSITAEWNFSTSVEFEKRMSRRLEDFAGNKSDDAPGILLNWQREYEEQRVRRGGKAMNAIFDPDAKPYSFGDEKYDEINRLSDLPFRNMQNGPGAARDRTTLIDLDIAGLGEGPNLELDNVPTLKARKGWQQMGEDDDENDFDPSRTSKRIPSDNQNNNRATLDWKFPNMPSNNIASRRTMDWSFDSAQAEAVTARRSIAPQDDFEDMPPLPGRPGLVHSKTMPVNPFSSGLGSSIASSPDRTSLIDLDSAAFGSAAFDVAPFDSALSISIPDISRPQTADSTADSAATDMTSGDPFDLELPPTQSNRGSLHIKSQSEPTAAFQISKQPQAVDALKNGSDASGPSHNRSSSMNRSDIDRNSQSPARRPWQARMAELTDPAIQPPWEPFSDPEEDLLREERKGWERKLGHRRRIQNSQSSARTATSSQGSVNYTSQTLRPPTRPGVKSGAKVQVRKPRDPDFSVLMPNVAKQALEEELAMVYEELGYQADTMIAQLQNMMEDEISESGSVVSEAPTTVVSEA